MSIEPGPTFRGERGGNKDNSGAIAPHSGIGSSDSDAAAAANAAVCSEEVSLYYCYVDVPVSAVDVLCAEQRALALRLGILGRIRVSAEGINGTLLGATSSLQEYENTTQEMVTKAAGAASAEGVGARYSGAHCIDFKRSAQPREGPRAFEDLMVSVVKQLVSGAPGDAQH